MASCTLGHMATVIPVRPGGFILPFTRDTSCAGAATQGDVSVSLPRAAGMELITICFWCPHYLVKPSTAPSHGNIHLLQTDHVPHGGPWLTPHPTAIDVSVWIPPKRRPWKRAVWAAGEAEGAQEGKLKD